MVRISHHRGRFVHITGETSVSKRAKSSTVECQTDNCIMEALLHNRRLDSMGKKYYSSHGQRGLREKGKELLKGATLLRDAARFWSH